MDLTFTEEQQAIIELADRILGDLCTPEQLRAVERDVDQDWPRNAWNPLADAGLLGVGLPEEVGGGGYGFCETALVVQAAARAAAPLPVYATLVLAASPIARFGSAEQQEKWLTGVVDGTTILTGMLTGENDSSAPPVCATKTTTGYTVTGVGWYVPYGEQASGYVVPVAMPDGRDVLAVIPADAPGVAVEPLAPMSGEPSATVRCTDTALEDEAFLVGSLPGDVDAARWMRERALAATCIAQTGTCEGALALTASYVSNREQFGVKLATLQAVSQRAADAYIDTELVRLTAWAGTWRLAVGEDATEEVAVAKYFAAEAAQRVVAAAQHLHGGIGMDLDYPVHRYFRWAKVYEHRLGGGTHHLAALGRRLADATSPAAVSSVSSNHADPVASLRQQPDGHHRGHPDPDRTEE